jgi:hypothetical protein
VVLGWLLGFFAPIVILWAAVGFYLVVINPQH